MFSDNAPVGVVKFGGEYYCITEAPFLHKIDPTTLETISKVRGREERWVECVTPAGLWVLGISIVFELAGVCMTRRENREE
ncbi:Beta,beta-carotene 15,15'-dioxygenase [Portunus trituberculatus]|uniref:Beta,beta-carotene 15,15'-dioxygenase n=1 Tax=Portunus trituberculatus TaxID=210409 RepID=A0A5B7IUJ5_PORTR|nr:Beta,beta-carotene 15,15'-dioxygenase [Portunus trituberculatus]